MILKNKDKIMEHVKSAVPMMLTVDEESKEVFSNLVTLSEKLELDLQEDDFIEILAVHHEELTNEDLMELEGKRKDEKSQEEEEALEQFGLMKLWDHLDLRIRDSSFLGT
ncbi:hypothetical protein J1605_008371 [Eschrichtius robustus]|uniref:Uncharacterized protein n=1 Tax=Eschrichtius robustus TaxID=9764 RepID=A0AB34H015_ESCRO|nr:hypothetical protein J1605_008371 [Eschrichtius robustus]